MGLTLSPPKSGNASPALQAPAWPDRRTIHLFTQNTFLRSIGRLVFLGMVSAKVK